MKKRKMMSFVLSVCMVVLAFSAVAVPASADANIATKRVLIMSGPYQDEINEDNADYVWSTFFEWNVTNNIYDTDYNYNLFSCYENDYNSGSNATFLNRISAGFGSADSNDVNYLYINCHGDSNGLLCVNGKEIGIPRLSMGELKQRLDSISGKFVIMFDVCYSGVAIGRDSSISSESFSQQLLNQFFGEDTRSGEFAGSQKYTVFCSSHSDQKSKVFGTDQDDFGIGFATLAWMRNLGNDYYTSVNGYTFTTSIFGADTNRDGIITAQQFGETSADFLEDIVNYCNNYGTTHHLQNFQTIDQDICFYRHNKMTTAFFNKYPLGDINKNYSINMSDVLLVRQYLAEAITLDSEQLKLADTNQSGNVNLQDVLELEKYLAEIAT